jgi:N-methylhydantoinase A/acetophenone carboxylase
LVTPVSAVFSAFGSSTLDVGHLYYRRVDAPPDAIGSVRLAEIVAAMRAEAERDLRGEGYAVDELTYGLELFVRNGGPETRVTVSLGSGDGALDDRALASSMSEAFGAACQDAGAPLTLTVVGLRAAAGVPHYAVPKMPSSSAAAGSSPTPKGCRSVFLDERAGAEELPVYAMGDLSPGHVVDGPALVESEDTTLLAQRGWRLTVDDYRNCVLEEAGR